MPDRIDPDATRMPLFVLEERYARIDVAFHAHRRVQLIHVSAGTLSVATRGRQLTIPPQRGVWIASGTPHRIVSSTPFTLTTCYVEPRLLDPVVEGLVALDHLARALLVEIATLGPAWQGAKAERLVGVLFDRLVSLPGPEPGLPLATEGPLARLTELVLADLSARDTLADLAPRSGLSERTAARRFRSEFGMTFGEWRRSARLQGALARLGAGASVTETAFDAGYRDTSSFITAFRKEHGVSPGRMFRGAES